MEKNFAVKQEELATQELKKRVIATLKYTVNFCEAHSLRYFMACGSALGTVRHHGMIPWDDDTDIYMLREDYEKLHDYYKEIAKDGFELVDLKIGSNYYCPSAKIVDKGSTLWEMEEYPYVVGAFVDIFPLDFAPIGMQGIVRKWTKLRNLYNRYKATIVHFQFHEELKRLIKFDFAPIPRIFRRLKLQSKRDSFLQEMFDYEDTLKHQEGDLLVSYTETGQYVFPKQWFEDYVLMSFEDFQVRMAKGYKEYLSYFYGDYMQLPPIEKRLSTHHRYYLNLREGLTVDQVKKRIKKGETLVI